MKDEPNDKSLVSSENDNYKKGLFKKIRNCLLLVVLIAATIIISISSKSTESLSYKENSNINYLVYLKPNDYYETPYLTKGMQYIASLIDYIDIDFNYNFKMNKEVIYDYDYYIEADVKVFEKGNTSNVIFQKKNKLVKDKVTANEESLDFNINENLKIDYGEYNDLIRLFKTSYNIIADSTLTLTLYVNVEGKYEKFEELIETNNSMNIVIPLSEQMLNIEMDYKDINNSDVITQTTKKGILNDVLLGITILFSVIFLVALIDLVKYASKLIIKKTPYQKKVDSLLTEYDRSIIEVDTDIKLKPGTKYINVNSFEELLDVSDMLQLPILYMPNSKKEETWFVIKSEPDIYRYILSASDVNEEG